MRTVWCICALALSGFALAQDAEQTGAKLAEPDAGAKLAAPESEDAGAKLATSEEGDAPSEGETAEEEAEASEQPEPTTARLAEEPDLAELVAAQAEQLAQQQRALQELNKQVTETRLELLKKPDLTFEMEGQVRTRAYMFNHLYQSQGTGDNYRDARHLRYHLRLRPVFKYKDLAKAVLEIRALDGVVWGDNASLNSTALFAQDPSSTDITGQDVDTLQMTRAYMEFSVPVGLLRVGRSPSDWGIGLLANDGNGFDDTFGENHYGNQNDRVLFATRPIAIAQAIMGKEGPDIPLVTAVAVDRIVEDPLIQYYGYECEAGIPDTDEDYRRACDSDGDGFTDLDHGWDDKSRTAEQRNPDWWADQNDDVIQMVYVLAYRGEDVRYLGGVGDLTLGTYIVHRVQQETESNAVIIDVYGKAHIHNLYAEFEGLTIKGKTRAITLPDFSADDPLAKRANILGYVARAGYAGSDARVIFETGKAGGDDFVNDGEFTGFSLNPDHNVGLLLYEEVLAHLTQQFWTETGRGLWSRGGVYNSQYIFPTASVSPLDNWELVGGFLMAWPNKPDGAIITCKDSDKVDCGLPSSQQATANALGWEVDFAIKHRWHEHLLFSLETGIAKTTDRLPTGNVGLNPEGNFFTVQSRMAWEF